MALMRLFREKEFDLAVAFDLYPYCLVVEAVLAEVGLMHRLFLLVVAIDLLHHLIHLFIVV